MPTKNVALIVDSSGSMVDLAKAARDGFNENLQTCAADERAGFDIKVWVTVFNSSVTFMAEGVPPSQAAEFTEASYKPDGGTALYDAIHLTVERMREATKDQTDSVYLVVIVTDGGENASVVHRGVNGLANVRSLIEKCKATTRWTFAFVCTEGLEDVAASLSIPSTHTQTFAADAGGVTRGLTSTTSYTANYFACANAGTSNAGLQNLTFAVPPSAPSNPADPVVSP